MAFRLAMDHPETVTKLVVMDGLPTVEHQARTDSAFARAWWHWWFLGQTDKPAEPLISRDPDSWYRTPPPEAMGPGNHADAWAAFHRPEAEVHGMAEDQRAGLIVDAADEAADRAAGRIVQSPTMRLQSEHDDLDLHGEPASTWAPWLDEPIERRLIDSGHTQAAQNPGAVVATLLEFLTDTPIAD